MARTMISVNIDRSEAVALHDQVAAEIRRAIAEGEAGPGEAAPLAKDIAAVLGVNKNTVLRAMHILRDEGLVEFGRDGHHGDGTPAKCRHESCAKLSISLANMGTRMKSST